MKPHTAQLVRMVAVQWHGRREVITVEEAEDLRCALGKAVTIQSCTATTIIWTVCDHFNLLSTQLATDRRDAHTALSRQVAMYFLREHTDLTWAQIGEHFPRKGRPRDPDTIRHGCRVIVARIQTDPAFQKRMQQIEKALTK